MEFEKGEEAGWHVILGTNGSGKSSVIRSFALMMMGEREAYASRQDFNRWIGYNKNSARISGTISADFDFDGFSKQGAVPKRPITPEVVIERSELSYARAADLSFKGEGTPRTIWGTGDGWFSASFGPFRRFTGGDRIYDRLFVSNKRLAPHLTALGEDVALTEALSWLSSLFVKSLQDEKSNTPSTAGDILNGVLTFINDSKFLPHDAKIEFISDDAVLILDGNGNLVSIDQLSDGYRSALSLTLEILRQMFELFGHAKVFRALELNSRQIMLPGVVAIDEVDAHLHPTWQRDIGRWLTRCFPNIQFIVTTHSPIVCRAVANDDGVITGGVWKLPAPGSDDLARRIEGTELEQLIFGDVLDAYGTELFGEGVTRSPVGGRMVERLAELNLRAIDHGLTEEEKREQAHLRATFPAEAGRLKA
ncbi:ATP-binding protein [Aquidulcibacter paucihalophilus]|nr:ATP-binding protein [Aquidulcibacter paucihalophilus]